MHLLEQLFDCRFIRKNHLQINIFLDLMVVEQENIFLKEANKETTEIVREIASYRQLGLIFNMLI